MQHIRQLSTRLGKVPALAYLAAYLLLILLFGLIFNSLPARHFRQLGASPDRPAAEPEASILQDLRDEIRRTYRMNGGSSMVVNGWRMLPDRLNVGWLHTSLPAGFNFELVLPVNNGTAGVPGTDGFIAATIIVHVDGRYVLSDTVFLPFSIENVSASPVVGIPTELPPPGMEFSVELREIPTGIAAAAIAPSTSQQTVLPLSQALYDRIMAYGEAVQGLPSTESRTPARMLHFSKAVATFGSTGDLVPRTALATLLAFAEAVIAVMLIGLFLNSLAYGLGPKLTVNPGTRRKTGRAPAMEQVKQATRHAAKRSKTGFKKEPAWWARTWVQLAVGIVVLGQCIALIAIVTLLRTLAVPTQSRPPLPVTILLPTQTPTATASQSSITLTSISATLTSVPRAALLSIPSPRTGVATHPIPSLRPPTDSISGTYRRAGAAGSLCYVKALRKPPTESPLQELDVELLCVLGPPSYNSGQGQMTLLLGEDMAVYSPSAKCNMVLQFREAELEVTQIGMDFDCGFGHGVYADGIYQLIDQHLPTIGCMRRDNPCGLPDIVP